MIEVNQTGVYITERGVVVEKKPVFITASEWEMLWALSEVSNKPIGTLIIKLALAESTRLKLS